MEFLDNLLGQGTEKRTQLYIHDDGSFEFRKLEFAETCLVEKRDSVVTKAWKHFYSSELPFNGYKNMHADMVTLGFDRDFILDPFDKVPITDNPASGKPRRTEGEIRHWTSQVAESQRYKVMNKPGSSLLVNKITIFLGVTLILMVLLLGASKACGS